MKRLLALLLATIMVFSLVGCGKNDTTSDNAKNEDVKKTDIVDVSNLTDYEKVSLAEQNVLDYLKAKYNSDAYIIDTEMIVGSDTIYLVPVKPINADDEDKYFHYIGTDISLKGDANLNFCKDDLQMPEIEDAVIEKICEVLNLRDIREFEEGKIIISPDAKVGIDTVFNGENIVSFLKELKENNCKIYIRNRGMSFDENRVFTEEEKDFLNIFEKIEIIYSENCHIEAYYVENVVKDFNTGFLPYIIDFGGGIQYDKTTGKFVDIQH